MTDPILEINGLKKNFVSGGIIEEFLGEKTVVNAVDEVDLEIFPNETVALIGESGCGKSTVAKTIMGIHPATEGEVIFDGKPLTKQNIGQKPVQIIFQDPGESLNQRKTIGNIIATPLKLRGVTNVEERVGELLEKVGLSSQVKNRYPGAFSGGQKQRIAIARALATEPEVLIADEPVSGLDVSVQAKIINLLNDLQEEMGLSMLLISHNLAVVRSIADRVDIMYLGRIVERGHSEDVFENPSHPYTDALLSAIHTPDPTKTRDRVILSGELPSPEDPPSGCRFHTRCPHAREVCSRSEPDNYEIEGDDEHLASCFRREKGHEYWDSSSIAGAEPVAEPSEKPSPDT